MNTIANTVDPNHHRWPDQHPKSKVRFCNLCGEPARLYTCGPRCDKHSPAAMRKAEQS